MWVDSADDLERSVCHIISLYLVKNLVAAMQIGGRVSLVDGERLEIVE